MGLRSRLIRMPGRPRAPSKAAPAAAITLTVFLFGCAQTGTAPGGSAPGSAQPGPLFSLFHRAPPVPAGHNEVLRLHGHGVQIFRCEAQVGDAHWVYRLPEAELDGPDGRVVVRHGVNLSFEHVDGSRLIGNIVDHVAAPDDDALPWLLIATKSFGEGALDGISYVQRINTGGGMPPARCEGSQAGQILRVPFTADFVFYR